MLLFAALAALVSCAGSPESASVVPGVVTVTMQSPAAAALPAGAEVIIRIVEVSGPDRAVVGTLKAPAGAPEYRVEYRKAGVRAGQSYGLEIVIAAEGKTVYLNRKPYFVLTRGNPDRVNVELEKR